MQTVLGVSRGDKGMDSFFVHLKFSATVVFGQDKNSKRYVMEQGAKLRKTTLDTFFHEEVNKIKQITGALS